MVTAQVAESSAIVYSLAETAKASRQKIYEYLKHLLTEVPKHMNNTSLYLLDGLFPWSENMPKEYCKEKYKQPTDSKENQHPANWGSRYK